MRTHFLLTFILISCVALGPASVFAAEDEALLYEYTPPGWGFSLGLADYGEVYEPGDPTWAADADLDWSWMSGIEDTSIAPIYRIDGKTITLVGDDGKEKVMTAEGFAEYYDYMVEQWTSSETTALLGSEPDIETADGGLWHMFHLHEENANGLLDYYSLLGLDVDGRLRQINFYYTPTDDAEMADAILGMVLLHLDPSLLEETEEE